MVVASLDVDSNLFTPAGLGVPHPTPAWLGVDAKVMTIAATAKIPEIFLSFRIVCAP